MAGILSWNNASTAYCKRFPDKFWTFSTQAAMAVLYGDISNKFGKTGKPGEFPLWQRSCKKSREDHCSPLSGKPYAFLSSSIWPVRGGSGNPRGGIWQNKTGVDSCKPTTVKKWKLLHEVRVESYLQNSHQCSWMVNLVCKMCLRLQIIMSKIWWWISIEEYLWFSKNHPNEAEIPSLLLRNWSTGGICNLWLGCFKPACS